MYSFSNINSSYKNALKDIVKSVVMEEVANK